jgi:glutamine synthetase
MAQRVEPAPPLVGNGFVEGGGDAPRLLTGMAEAISAMRASAFARDWLGPRFVETFTATRAAQLGQFKGKTLIDERRRFFELG